MAVAIKPGRADPETYLRVLYKRTEQSIINEIFRKRSNGYVDYAEVAALERIQNTLQGMVDESYQYIPQMVEKRYDGVVSAGYRNAKKLTSVTNRQLMEMLTDNLLGEIIEASQTAYQTSRKLYALARLGEDAYRKAMLETTLYTEALGKGAALSSKLMESTVRSEGITGFVDKSGRRWSLYAYCNMATRTTARQAEVAGTLEKDTEHDLYMISKVGTTCPVCAPLEGRVYSKSGTSEIYPPLSLAFGKIDPNGGDDLSNTYLNIHPNCLVPGGFVLAESVISESRRFYCGKVITLKTSAGNEITITPNHPVLTDRGFVPADGLAEGDKIIEASGKYGSLIRETPNNVNIKAVLNEELHAFMQTVSRSACSVEGTPEQFHGDGCVNQKVDIVFTDSLGAGERNVMRSEEVKEQGFPTGQLRVFQLLTNSPFTKVFIGALHSLDRIVGGFRFVRSIKKIPVHFKQLANLSKRTAALLGNLRKRKTFVVELKKFIKLRLMGFTVFFRNLPVRFPVSRAVLDTFVISHTKVADCGGKFLSAEVVLPTNLRKAEPLVYKRLQDISSKGGLQISRLCHKESSFYRGYVYNFETEHSFYVYNNIVTHNCLHSIVPWTEAGKTEAQIKRIREFSDPKTNPLTKDPRSKKQIEAYRLKEKNRREKLAELRKKQAEKVAKAMPKKPPEPPKPEPKKEYVSTFTPAKTMQEAEEYAKTFTDANGFGAVGVSYKGVDLDIANRVNKAIGDFYGEYDVGKFGGVIAPAGNTKLGKAIGNATAGYSPIRNSFILNRASLKDAKSAAKALKAESDAVKGILEHPERYDIDKLSRRVRQVIENSRLSGRGTVPETVEDVINHELGHSLERALKNVPNYAAIQERMPQFAQKISGYASDSFSEYIAESFCSYKKGENLIDPELVKAFESLKRKL